jgi:hypothetical protein
MPEIESWLTNLFSCVFGKAIGYQLWWSWHGLSPAAAQLNWNADYKFRQHRRSEYVNLLKKYGGGIVITLGGFCLAGGCVTFSFSHDWILIKFNAYYY